MLAIHVTLLALAVLAAAGPDSMPLPGTTPAEVSEPEIVPPPLEQALPDYPAYVKSMQSQYEDEEPRIPPAMPLRNPWLEKMIIQHQRMSMIPSGVYREAESLYPNLVQRYMAYEDSPRVPMVSDRDWLSKEIDRIQMKSEPIIGDEEIPDGPEPRWVQRRHHKPVHPLRHRVLPFTSRARALPSMQQIRAGLLNPNQYYQDMPKRVAHRPLMLKRLRQGIAAKQHEPTEDLDIAIGPDDNAYYEPDNPKTVRHENPVPAKVPKKASEETEAAELIDPRQVRQNPNLSRSKTLIAENLDRLRIGVSDDGTPHSDPVSPGDNVYIIAFVLVAAAVITLAILGFAFGWYTLSKKAKAAADVDYPAYGVTGPSQDASGDRKLAQSAHMYHYQHQKQQIIALERSGMDQPNGSVSDPDSEEENEEGDYTVYECPGFATVCPI